MNLLENKRMKKQTKEYLINFFKEDIKSLSLLINKDLNHCRNKKFNKFNHNRSSRAWDNITVHYLGQHNDIYLSKIKEPHF